MSDLITTLHPQDDNSVNLYPNIKLENIIDGTAEDAGKFVKVNEEGKFIVDTVNIPEPQQVNNSTVTIKQGGVDKGSFTLNQAEDATIELDAGSTGGSGSSMYATSSAISKGVPAHFEAANPIQVGDTISQFYFNTQQDIKSYLETCVDWGNGKKVIYADGVSFYPLFTTISDENEAGFRELKVGAYIYGLKIKADYAPGDGKVDPELNSWLATILSSVRSVRLFDIGDFSNSNTGLLANKEETSSGTEYTLSCPEYSGTVIYSSINGFKADADNWDPQNHSYYLVRDHSNNKETVITGISKTESAGWNGIFFGAVSNLGEIVLSAIKWIGTLDNYSLEDVYMILPNPFAAEEAFNNIYYSSSPFPGPGTVIKGGWHVTADQAVMLNKPEKVTTVNNVVSKIASSEANWISIPEVFGNIYQDDILGTDEVKVDDILVDTSGTLGKVKELSEELVKNQHPASPFTVGDEIPANSYVYIDTSITPDLSKLDWSGFDLTGSGGLFPLAPLSSFVLSQFTQFMALDEGGVKLNKPVYALTINDGTCSYYQVDPSDIDKVLNDDILPGEFINNWYFSEQVTHEGSIFKVPLGDAEAITLTDISDQDIWGAYISKDGKWVEDTPILRTKVSCEALRQLPTNYDNLDGIPIIKSDYTLTDNNSYQFIPSNYPNKYIQDPTGIIYFCDGQQLYQLKGSSKFTVNISVRDGLKTYNTSTSPTGYSTDIGLNDITLSNTPNDYSVFAKRGTNFGWIAPTSTSLQAGSGIEVSGNTINLTSKHVNRVINSESSGMYVMARDGITMSDPIGWGPVSIPHGVIAGTGLTSTIFDTTRDTLSLSQDVQDKLAKIPDTAIETYSEGTGIALTQTSGNDKQISLSQDYITKLKPIMDAQDDLITDLVHKTTDNETAILAKYTKPETGIPASDLTSDVQASLTKANSALQESALSGYATTSQVNAKYTKPATGIPETDLSADVQGALTKANSSISGVKVNGTQVTVTDGVADIGTVITAHQSLDGKQDKLSDTQLKAVNSGITSDKVSTYDGYAALINGKQGALDETQLAAVNSGITTAKVTKYDGYESSINGKQDKLSETQLAATNSGMTSAKVSTYDGYATSIQTLTTNLSSSDAKITQNTADIAELKTSTVKKADMKGLELPDLPTADGNYALTCTITGGVATFAWTLAN